MPADKKLVIGLYGEMRLAMELHERGWQVHRAYIDEGIDFVISKYYCPHCNRYSNQLIRHTTYRGRSAKCVTNLCEHCGTTELTVVSKYLQVKTSEGVDVSGRVDVKDFSFHPKIRYNMGDDIFYAWIAVFDTPTDKKCHFYIFNSRDVTLFDNITLDTYQVTDNQQTHLYIREDGSVTNTGRLYSYDCFNTTFYNNWDCLE